jgi:GTP pyrophosphokinase
MVKKIKDYISIPKANGYQSLHTTVIGMFRFPVEVQIRTQSMDDIAEYGVAAHFVYSDRHTPDQISESQAAWIKRLQDLVATYQNSEDKESFKQEMSLQVLSKSVFLYTPKGDIFEMPQGSTVLDFAFRVHTDIGLSFKSAIVNGVIKPIGYQPQSGDIIDIKSYRNKTTATKYWLDFLHTSSARNKLQRHIKKQEKDEILARSLIKLQARLTERKLPLIGSEEDHIRKSYKDDEREKHLINMYHKQESYSLFFKKAYPDKRRAFHEHAQDANNQKEEQKTVITANTPHDNVVIDHHHHLSYRLCTNCHPTSDDKIIAKSGRGGIVIHAVDCQ